MNRSRRSERVDESRRTLLVNALSLGVLAGGAGWNRPAYAALFGRVPYRMPENRSVFDVRGPVTADGKPVSEQTLLSGREKIEVGPGGHLVAVVGKEAFIVRERSSLELQITRSARSVFRLVSGAMLTVFGRRSEEDEMLLATPIATLGIRGTGVYLESDPDKSYICTCYGTTLLTAAADPDRPELAVSRHHDAPKYVLAQPDAGKHIVPAPFKNHTDLELITLETLVGRTVPFAAPGTEYEAPRREDY